MFAPANQTHFSLTIEGLEHDLQVLEFSGFEAISQPFAFELELVSQRPDLDLESLLHKPAFLALSPDGTGIHGQLYRVAQGESGKRLTRYHVRLRPQLAYLAHRINQRIFQHLTVPKIIAQVLQEHGIQANAYQFQLSAIYPERDYCVQYDESDLHFVQRLCEEEGIHYHFQHSSSAHVLVFGDDQTVFPKLPIQSYQQGSGLVADIPLLKRFGVRVETRTSRVSRRDYDFEKPRLLLESTAKGEAQPDLEDYDYPGRFVARERGKHLSQRALERHRADYELAEGESDQPLLVTGHFLPLTTHPRQDWNQLWLLTSIEHEGKQPQVLEESVTSHTETGDGFTQGYRNRLTATPWDVLFRPSLEHPKPKILGSQTAKVTGPAGEEIHCDQYGQVKVQFHWDRDGQADDYSSCWLRVASSWAGDRYGAIAIPRVGMEVLVTFLEGDPDQPLITGCLFHKEHVVPYDLSANKTRSVFKTLSSPGGEGFNELRIEDRKGAEQIFLHAQRDWDENIEHDQKIRVGNQRHDTVEANSYSEFKAEEHRTIHTDRKTEVKASDHLTIGQNQHVKIGTGQFISAGQEIHLSSGQKIVLEAGSELTLKAAGSFIKLDAGGVTMVGPLIKFNSGGGPGSGSGISILGPLLPGAAAMALAGNLLKTPAANALALEPDEEEIEEEEEEEELEEEQGITLRIGVFFDGTGNNLANAAVTEKCRRDDLQLLDAKQLQSISSHCKAYGYSQPLDGQFSNTPNNSYAGATSNVAQLYALYSDDSYRALEPDTKTASLKIYLEGIGTSSGEADSAYGQITGKGDTGVLARVEQSPAALRKALERLLSNNPEFKISKIEFDIFGFSRGAASARHFANEVLKSRGGLLSPVLNAEAPGLLPEFAWRHGQDVSINFIGLFDTVAAIVDSAQGDFSPANSLNPGVNLYLPPGCANKVLQLSAADELRWNFAHNSVAPHHQEIRLPGVHSDLGGGYGPNEAEHYLLSQPQSSTVAVHINNQNTAAYRTALVQQQRLEQLGLPGAGHMDIDLWTENLPKDHGESHSKYKRVYAAVAIKRHVRGELSLVYLRVMRELAVKFNVPFSDIRVTPSTAIPAELSTIADKIAAYARGGANTLTVAERQLLHAKYIHLSANWTPVKGLLVNKPASNVRLIYNNKPQEGYPQ